MTTHGPSLRRLHALEVIDEILLLISSDGVANFSSYHIVLELSYRSLPVAPTYITAVNALTRLDLSHNCLEYLPEDIGSLTK